MSPESSPKSKSATSLSGITAVSSEIMSIPPEFYSITIHEIDDASYGIGGKCIDVVKREYMDKHASQREDA